MEKATPKKSTMIMQIVGEGFGPDVLRRCEIVEGPRYSLEFHLAILDGNVFVPHQLFSTFSHPPMPCLRVIFLLCTLTLAD